MNENEWFIYLAIGEFGQKGIQFSVDNIYLLGIDCGLTRHIFPFELLHLVWSKWAIWVNQRHYIHYISAQFREKIAEEEDVHNGNVYSKTHWNQLWALFFLYSRHTGFAWPGDKVRGTKTLNYLYLCTSGACDLTRSHRNNGRHRVTRTRASELGPREKWGR